MIPAHKSLKHCVERANSDRQGNSAESIARQTKGVHIESALLKAAASEVNVAFTAQGGEAA